MSVGLVDMRRVDRKRQHSGAGVILLRPDPVPGQVPEWTDAELARRAELVLARDASAGFDDDGLWCAAKQRPPHPTTTDWDRRAARLTP